MPRFCAVGVSQATHLCFQRLHVAFQSIDAGEEPLEVFGDGGEEFPRRGFSQDVPLEVGGLHGPAAGEQPVGADAEDPAQGRDELHARRLPLHVSADGLGMGSGPVRHLSVGGVLSNGQTHALV